MSFGFSIGDLLASAELCYKVARSIKDGPSQLKAARSSLRALITVLKRIEKDFEKLSLQLAMGEDTDRKEEFDDLMFGCRVTVRKFQKIVAKYDETGAGGKEMKMVGFKGLRWSLIDCKALPGIQCEIGMHLDSLNAIVNAQQSTVLAQLSVDECDRHAAIMEKLDQILQLVLQGQKGPEILLPKVDEHTGETDISELVDQLKQRGIPEEEVDDTVVRDYIEEHREEVSTYVTALSQRDYMSAVDFGEKIGSISGKIRDLDFGENESIVLQSEHAVPWNTTMSEWLDIKDQLSQDLIGDGNTQDQDGSIASGENVFFVVNRAVCPLCLAVLPMRNIYDHVTKVHDQAQKENFLVAMSKETGHGLLGTTDHEPVMHHERSAIAHFNEGPVLTSPYPGKPSSPPHDEDKSLKVSCPACFEAVDLENFSEHVASHDGVDGGTLSSWKTLLAPANTAVPPSTLKTGESPRETELPIHSSSGPQSHARSNIPPILMWSAIRRTPRLRLKRN